jgi:FkbM family methyltransferase
VLADNVTGLVAEFNERALLHMPVFRHVVADRAPSTYDPDFGHARLHFPYFGYIRVGIDGCHDFLMLSNNDDLVAQHYFWYGRNGYERCSIREWVKRARSADVVLDIGAFTGLYGLAAHFINDGAEVHLVEPTYRAFSRILENCQINFLLDAVHCHRMAVSDVPKQVEFMHFRNKHEIGSGASYVEKQGELIHERETCAATTIDALAHEIGRPPGLIKVDVETAEVDVVRGAKEVIAAASASFFVEVVPDTIVEVIDAFAGYSCWLVDESADRLVSLQSEYALVMRSLETHSYANLIFDPPGGPR